MRRVLLLVVALLGFVARAEALTVRDIIELSRAGLGEEVLLALIDVDRGVYRIDNATLKSLKDAGVPERVIVALVRSGRERAPDRRRPHRPPRTRRRRPSRRSSSSITTSRRLCARCSCRSRSTSPWTAAGRGIAAAIDRTPVESTYVPFQSGPPLPQPQLKRPEPVYWGFGGKLRPDAWKPDGYKESRERSSDNRPADKDKK